MYVLTGVHVLLVLIVAINYMQSTLLFTNGKAPHDI